MTAISRLSRDELEALAAELIRQQRSRSTNPRWRRWKPERDLALALI